MERRKERREKAVAFSYPFSLSIKSANGFCIHWRTWLTISSAAEHSSGKLQSWELPGASPSPINLLLTQSVRKVAGRRYFFSVLKDHTEQSFATAEMQLPPERHVITNPHLVRVCSQSGEVRWNNCSSWCMKEFRKDGIWTLSRLLHTGCIQRRFCFP